MLRNDRAKFAAMIVAVSMAVFLMQNQAAILATMLSMTAAQIRDVEDADLWVTEPDVECFDQVKAMLKPNQMPDKIAKDLQSVRKK